LHQEKVSNFIGPIRGKAFNSKIKEKYGNMGSIKQQVTSENE
jgi:hypothetical protein